MIYQENNRISYPFEMKASLHDRSISTIKAQKAKWDAVGGKMLYVISGRPWIVRERIRP